MKKFRFFLIEASSDKRGTIDDVASHYRAMEQGNEDYEKVPHPSGGGSDFSFNDINSRNERSHEFHVEHLRDRILDWGGTNVDTIDHTDEHQGGPFGKPIKSTTIHFRDKGVYQGIATVSTYPGASPHYPNHQVHALQIMSDRNNYEDDLREAYSTKPFKVLDDKGKVVSYHTDEEEAKTSASANEGWTAAPNKVRSNNSYKYDYKAKDV